jgi:hypothetical protein
VRLRPYTFFGAQSQVPIDELISKPGIYHVYVEYQSPMSKRFLPPPADGVFWGREQGSVRSNVVEFKVR